MNGPTRDHVLRRVAVVAVVAIVLASCSSESGVARSEPAATVPPTPTVIGDEPQVTEPVPEPEVEPQPFVPAGQPGSAQAYNEMIDRLEQLVPLELRRQVPWPDLRNPNPVVAQVEIFDLWIWMEAYLPEPALVEVMSAPDSPSREQVAGIFGRQQADNVLETRPGASYRAFDHRMVTFESAGLPLWLTRDVPADAVAVYYSDDSGPVRVTDRDTGEVVNIYPATTTRSWLALMVPTEVGWQLYRDEIIDASLGIETPDVPPVPGPSDDRPTTEV